MKTLDQICADANTSAIAFKMGMQAGKRQSRPHVIQAVMATSVAWVALFGLALVMLP